MNDHEVWVDIRASIPYASHTGYETCFTFARGRKGE